MLPTSVSSTTVTLKTAALASAGTSQRPATGKARVEPAASAGPPDASTGPRVSARRQGVTVKRSEDSSSRMVAVAAPRAIVAPAGAERLAVKDSLGSARVSPTTGTIAVCTVLPAGKPTVPELAV